MSYYVPEGTFIHSYMEMMKEQETPTIYDFICACWVLSNILGRDIIVARPRAPVHLNMYVILVSESGIMRKSTSIRVATSLVRGFLQQSKRPTLLIESKVTAGMVLNELSLATRKHDTAQMVLVASELAAVLGRGSSISGLPALLTDLYDCPDVRSGGGSLNTGEFNFKNVYSSFLGGSTPSWLAKAVRPEIIEGGFTSRCYFVTGRQRKRTIAWADGEINDSWQANLLSELQRLRNHGERNRLIDTNSNARAAFTRWYENRSFHKDAYRESFESREDSHVLRFAGIFAANENAWEINTDHIQRAINIVSDLKRNGAELFTGVEVEKHDIKTLHRLRNLLLGAASVGLSRSEIYRSLRASGRQADEIRSLLNTFHELDLVKVFEVPLVKGRPRTMYVATEYLKNEQFLADVARKLGIE